ncbi:MAG: hypothetical protein JNL74_07270 [Fibrobacteres bacterium]|nr:hypothetical protein [Fibrobacterota bacterium]
MKKIITFIICAFIISNCSKSIAPAAGMDLRYASVYIKKHEPVTSLKKLPDWPNDSTESKVLINLSDDLFNKFNSEFNRRMRNCSYRTVEHPDMADALIALTFPVVAMRGDTFVIRAELNIADRRSGRKEAYNFETRLLRNNTSKAHQSPFHEYGRLLNETLKKFNTTEMVNRICP